MGNQLVGGWWFQIVLTPGGFYFVDQSLGLTTNQFKRHQVESDESCLVIYIMCGSRGIEPDIFSGSKQKRDLNDYPTAGSPSTWPLHGAGSHCNRVFGCGFIFSFLGTKRELLYFFRKG